MGFAVGDTLYPYEGSQKRYISLLNKFFTVTHANETFASPRLVWENDVAVSNTTMSPHNGNYFPD